jgi:hypothetical protein
MPNANLVKMFKDLKAEMLCHQATTTTTNVLELIRRDPKAIMEIVGKTPDPWQARILGCSNNRILLCASRQSGKTTCCGSLALRTALLQKSLVLVLSASERQSKEFLGENIVEPWRRLGQPVGGEAAATSLHLNNGSRILALPESEKTIRVYSGVNLLVIDEAARVPDCLFEAVRPMLAVSGGRLVCLSSAYAKVGFYYRAWSEGGSEWYRVKVLAEECQRISKDFLAEEWTVLGDRIYEREYECVFSSADDAAFDGDSIRRAMNAVPSGPALFVFD